MVAWILKSFLWQKKVMVFISVVGLGMLCVGLVVWDLQEIPAAWLVCFHSCVDGWELESMWKCVPEGGIVLLRA